MQTHSCFLINSQSQSEVLYRSCHYTNTNDLYNYQPTSNQIFKIHCFILCNTTVLHFSFLKQFIRGIQPTLCCRKGFTLRFNQFSYKLMARNCRNYKWCSPAACAISFSLNTYILFIYVPGCLKNVCMLMAQGLSTLDLSVFSPTRVIDLKVFDWFRSYFSDNEYIAMSTYDSRTHTTYCTVNKEGPFKVHFYLMYMFTLNVV